MLLNADIIPGFKNTTMNKIHDRLTRNEYIVNDAILDITS